MTFNKYKQGREKFNDCIFPKENYDFEYVWTKSIGWHVVRGKKLPELEEKHEKRNKRTKNRNK